MKHFAEIKNKKIIIDTNILINCGDDRYKEDFKKMLKLLSADNDLGASVISGFEIIKKYHKKETFSYYLKLLNFIKKIPVSVEIAQNAGFIAKSFGPDKEKKDNDIIIGATVASTKKSLLLTCDRKDFNRPYWGVVARECILWENKETDQRNISNVFLLAPNWTALEK